MFSNDTVLIKEKESDWAVEGEIDQHNEGKALTAAEGTKPTAFGEREDIVINDSEEENQREMEAINKVLDQEVSVVNVGYRKVREAGHGEDRSQWGFSWVSIKSVRGTPLEDTVKGMNLGMVVVSRKSSRKNAGNKRRCFMRMTISIKTWMSFSFQFEGFSFSLLGDLDLWVFVLLYLLGAVFLTLNTAFVIFTLRY